MFRFPILNDERKISGDVLHEFSVSHARAVDAAHHNEQQLYLALFGRASLHLHNDSMPTR